MHEVIGYTFEDFVTPENPVFLEFMFESCARPENVKEFKEKFGFNFESCDGIFLLQATCIYIYIKFGLKVKEDMNFLANKKIDDLVAEFEKSSTAPVKK